MGSCNKFIHSVLNVNTLCERVTWSAVDSTHRHSQTNYLFHLFSRMRGPADRRVISHLCRYVRHESFELNQLYSVCRYSGSHSSNKFNRAICLSQKARVVQTNRRVCRHDTHHRNFLEHSHNVPLGVMRL